MSPTTRASGLTSNGRSDPKGWNRPVGNQQNRGLTINRSNNNNIDSLGTVGTVPPPTARDNDSVVDPLADARQLRAVYDKHLEDMGVAQGKDTERYVLRNFVYETIWSLKKFVGGEHEMEATGLIATLVFEGVNVDVNNRPEYWKRNRGYVIECINTKRSNTSGSIKREFVSKYCCEVMCRRIRTAHRHTCFAQSGQRICCVRATRYLQWIS